MEESSLEKMKATRATTELMNKLISRLIIATDIRIILQGFIQAILGKYLQARVLAKSSHSQNYLPGISNNSN